MTAVIEGVATRQRIRDWWKAALDGKAEMRVADLARDAETELGLDAEFRDGFVDEFLYAVIYEAGISMLSQRRAALDENGEWVGDPSLWLEYEPNSGRHIAIERMTPDQARAAFAFREARVKTELERIEALKQIAEGTNVDAVIKVAASNGRRPVSRTEQSPDAIGEDDRLVICRFCKAEIGVRFGEVYAPGDDVCGECERKFNYLKQELGYEHRSVKCCCCGALTERGSDFEPWPNACAECGKKYPPALIKSVFDEFDYAMQLRTGEIIHYSHATICPGGEWISLSVKSRDWYSGEESFKRFPFPFERGIDVRVADNEWVCDAPYGS